MCQGKVRSTDLARGDAESRRPRAIAIGHVCVGLFFAIWVLPPRQPSRHLALLGCCVGDQVCDESEKASDAGRHQKRHGKPRRKRVGRESRD